MKGSTQLARTLWLAAGAAMLARACHGQDIRFDARPPVASTGTLSSGVLEDLDGDGDLDLVATEAGTGRLIWIENNCDVDPGFTVEHTITQQLISPRTVATGDIDGDGDPDIAAGGSSATGEVVWFENLGGVPPQFAERLVGLRPSLESSGIVRSVALADLEGDGDLDIVCGFLLPKTALSGHVTIYLNDGGPVPSFVRQQLASPTLSLLEISDLAVADVNADTSLDIVAVSRHPVSGDDADSLVVWANSGTIAPSFSPSLIANALADPAALAVARLDGDTLPDLAIAQQQTDRVTILQNDPLSPGSFIVQQSIPAQGVSDLVAGDFVGGTQNDIVAATLDGPQMLQNLGGAGPVFSASLLESPDGETRILAAGPIDAGSDLDLVASGPDGTRWIERVAPVTNLTTGAQFASIEDAVAAVGAGEVLSADAEHFVPDLVVPAAVNSFELRGTGEVVLGPRSLIQSDQLLTVAAPTGKTIRVRGKLSVASGGGVLFDSSEPVAIESGQVIVDAEVASVASTLGVRLRPSWLPEEIDGDLSASPTGLVDEPRDIRLFRPDAEGDPSLVAVSETVGGGNSGVPGSLTFYVSNPQSPTGWSPFALDDAGVGTHRSVAPGDLNRDGDEDLVSVFVPADGNPPELRIHVSDGASFPSFLTTSVALSQADGAHVVFDLDRDGLADIVTPTGYYRQSFDLVFTFVPFPLVGNDTGLGVAVARLNPDFDPDVVVHTATRSGPFLNVTGYRLVALEADGMGGFVPTVIDLLDRSMDPTCVGDCYPDRNVAITNANTLRVIDLEHDGDDDVVLSEDAGLAIYENAGGAFVPIASYPQFVWDECVPVDFDADGVLDLAVASTAKSAIFALENPILGGGSVHELLRPVERAAAIDAGDLDGDDDVDLIFAASAFDRITVIRQGPLESIRLVGSAAELRAQTQLSLVRGTINMGDSAVDSGGELLIGKDGRITGFGQLLGMIFNGGVLAPRPWFVVDGNYVQFDAFDPSCSGTLDMLLPTSSPDPLFVTGTAALAGDLRVETAPGVTLGPGARRLVTAQSFDPVLDRFDITLVPRLQVNLAGQLEPGVGIVNYGQFAGQAIVELGPQSLVDPIIGDSPFAALDVPADGAIGDLVGGPNGGPDGVPDLVIAYPVLPNAKSGGVALLAGELAGNGCRFRPIGVYQGQNADAPDAVEIGDFDADGVPEIAFGNRGDSFTTNLVHFLDANSASQTPLTDSMIPPIPIEGDRWISDLAIIALGNGPIARGPSAPATVLTLSDSGLAGTVTASTFNTAIGSWEVCDIDVCDDPDSFDPIDPDGPAAALGQGFASTSTDDDKVVVASNTGVMPEDFPTEGFASGKNPTEIRGGDLNNDGFPDIAAINEAGGTVSVFVNIANAGSPGGRSFESGVEWTLRSEPVAPDPLPSSIALADLDNDGDLDIAVVSTDSDGIRAVRSLTNLFVETGSLSFTLPENLPTQPTSTPLLVREFDAEAPGGVVLNDDLVVLVDPSAGSSEAGGGLERGAFHAVLCSEAPVCLPDTNGDGQLTPADFNAWIIAFNNQSPACDQNGDGLCTPADFNAWIINYNAGC